MFRSFFFHLPLPPPFLTFLRLNLYAILLFNYFLFPFSFLFSLLFNLLWCLNSHSRLIFRLTSIISGHFPKISSLLFHWNNLHSSRYLRFLLLLFSLFLVRHFLILHHFWFVSSKDCNFPYKNGYSFMKKLDLFITQEINAWGKIYNTSFSHLFIDR